MKGYPRIIHLIPVLLMKYSFRVVMLGVLLSSPSWAPFVCSSITKPSITVFHSNILMVISTPKWLFLLSNIIIIFLVGESRLARSSPQPDMYEEYYVFRKQNLHINIISYNLEFKREEVEKTILAEGGGKEDQQAPNNEEEEEEEHEEGCCDADHDVEPYDQVLEEKLDENGEEAGLQREELADHELEPYDQVLEEKMDENGEEAGLQREELNKRVEDFIAMFNLQRKMEESMLIYC